MKKSAYIFLIALFLFSLQNISAGKRIVVLGSSTAEGAGASTPKNAWVNLLKVYLEDVDPNNEVINLARGGYTTYNLMPTENHPSEGRAKPDVERNISKAINLKPQAIIISLPSNDVANGYSQEEIFSNYKKILEESHKANIPVWVTSTQPRNFSSKEQLQQQYLIYKQTMNYWGEKAVDFWSFLSTPEHTLKSEYDAGDGIHLNDLGHKLLFNKIVEKITEKPVETKKAP